MTGTGPIETGALRSICSDQLTALQLIPMSSPHPADTRTSDIGHGASSRQPLAASGLTFNAQMP